MTPLDSLTTIRDKPALLALVAQVRQETDHGEHSIGAVWWRERLSCPTREQLSMALEEILDVCAMPATEALELISKLKTMGVIEFE